MNKNLLVSRVLLVDGALLCIIAFVHLADTPIVGMWLSRQLSAELLNSVSPFILLSQFIGIVIIPFGVSTMYSAAGVRAGHRWAKMIALTNSAAVIILPLIFIMFIGFQYTGNYILLFADVLMLIIGLSMFLLLLWL